MASAVQESYAPIVANGGFLLIDNLLPGENFRGLRDEALSKRNAAKECLSLEHDISGFRGGNPARWFRTAPGGSNQTAVYLSTALARTVADACGRPVKPTGKQGTYSYYDATGHFLGLHRDIRTCDVTLITCLHRAYSPEESGALRIYYKSVARKLSDILARGDQPYLDIHLEPRQSVLLLGGLVPHEVRPAGPGYERCISVLCFEMM
jgi:hypothetical protein